MESCNSEQFGLTLCFLNGIKLKKYFTGSKEDFGGVSITAIGDLFQLQPVMDGYIFKDVDNSEYGVLATNLW